MNCSAPIVSFTSLSAMPSSATMQHLRGASPAIRTCLSAARRARRTARTVMYSSATTNTTSSASKRTYYQVLGVPEGASPYDIRASFRRLAKSLHPDHNKLPGAMEKFKEVKLAYDVLLDASARAEYDRELKVQALAEAQLAAQAAAGGKRAATLGFRRNKAAPSPRVNTASPRRASGDDFEQFAASSNPIKAGPDGARGSRGSEDANYTSIFSDTNRTSSPRVHATQEARGGPSYRSIFDTRSRSSSPLQQQPSSQSLSGNAGGVRRASSSSGYATSISSGPGTPAVHAHGASTSGTSPPQPRSTSRGSSNPCIFNGRSISPNLGVLPQQQQPAAATAPHVGGPSPARPPTPAPASAPKVATNTVSASSPNNRGVVIDPGHVSTVSANSNLPATGSRPQMPSGRPFSNGHAYSSEGSSFSRSTGPPGSSADSNNNPRQSQSDGIGITEPPSAGQPASGRFTVQLMQQTITTDGSRRHPYASNEDTVRLQSQQQAPHQAAVYSVYSNTEFTATQSSSKTSLRQGQEPTGNARSPESNTSVATAPVTLQLEAEAVQATAKVAAAMAAAAEAKRAAAAAEAMAAEAAAVAAAAKAAALEAEARLNDMLEGATSVLPLTSGDERKTESLLPWTSLQNKTHERPEVARTYPEKSGDIERAQGDVHADEVSCEGREEETRVEMTPLSVAVNPLWPTGPVASELLQSVVPSVQSWVSKVSAFFAP